METKNMDFFRHMKEIAYCDYAQFLEEVDTCRRNMLTADTELLRDSGRMLRFDDAFDLADGRMVIEYKEVKFECFFHYKPNAPLYVFLNGALTKQRPQFSRWSYYTFANGSVLNIADPMYGLYDELILGWYYGNEDFNLRMYTAEVIKGIAGKIGVANDNIILYGSSGGGAAVIECASHIKGCRAVAINPQVVLSEYFYAEKFREITHNMVSREDKWHRDNAIYYLKHNCGSKHLLLVNIRCESDMQQVDNICKAMGIKVKYGLNVHKDLLIWLYDCYCEPYENAHNIQDSVYMFFAIEKVLESMEDQSAPEELDAFCRYIGEWWQAWWKKESYWRSRQPNLHYLALCNKSSKKTALFGTGDDARKLCRDLLDIPGENYYGVQEIFDNNKEKSGDDFNGITIRHPEEVNSWSCYFIIIATLRYMIDVRKQLEGYGLVYGEDFITLKDLYK